MESGSAGAGAGRLDAIEIAKSLLFLGAPFGIGIGCLHLQGYWGEFEINVFQYAGVSDIVSTALVPLMVLVLLNLFSSAAGFFAGYSSGTEPTRPEPSFLRRIHDSPDVILRIFLIGCVLSLIFLWEKRWFVIPVMLYLGFVRFTSNRPFKISSKMPAYLQKMIFSLLLFIGLQSYGIGIIRANLIIDGDSYNAVVSSNISSLVHDGPDDRKVRFIGHVGDYDFFLDPMTSVVKIMKVQDENLLALSYQKKQEPVLEWLDESANRLKVWWGALWS